MVLLSRVILWDNKDPTQGNAAFARDERKPFAMSSPNIPVDALVARLEIAEARYERAERRFRILSGLLVGGIVAVALLPGALPAWAQGYGVTLAQLATRMTAVETKTASVSTLTVDNQPTVRFSGVNVQIVSGTGSTVGAVNGRGNLIIGYNESDGAAGDERTGSHNMVVGISHDYTSYGGFLAGIENRVIAPFASVSGGIYNTASGGAAIVCGGYFNTSSGDYASVLGGNANIASGSTSSVSGGRANRSEGFQTSILGGDSNLADGEYASVGGGRNNGARGSYTSVGGGRVNLATGPYATISGGLNNASEGNYTSVTGGTDSTAQGDYATVSGGYNRSAPAEYDWAGGGLFQTQ